MKSCHNDEYEKICKLKVCKLKAKEALVGDLTVCHDQTVKGNLTVLGTTTTGSSVVNHNETVKGNFSVLGSTNLNDLTVNGNTNVAGLTAKTIVTENLVATDSLTANKANILDASIENLDVKTITHIHTINSDITNTETLVADGAFIDHADIGCLKQFDCQRWDTPNYDRFKQGTLPKLNPVPWSPGTYEYENLTHLALPEQGNNWSAVVRGFINFNTASASEKLQFYAGAVNRLYRLVINRAWYAQEEEIKVGFLQGWNNYQGGTLMQPAIPNDQQKYASDALQIILNGFLTINVADLNSSEATNYYNHLTICKVFIEAWDLGDFDTSNMGAEYANVTNKHMRSNYCWLFNNFPPLINFSFVVAAGINSDPQYLLTWARALPILFTYFETVMNQHIQAGLDGLKLGFYPHVLRVNPYDSKGKSTMGAPEPEYNYEQYIIDDVANNSLAITDNSISNAQQDFDIVDLSFEENLSDDVLFGFNSIGGTNPQYLIDLVVNAGEMSSIEGEAIMAFCKDKYYSSVMPAMKRFLNAYYFDVDSPMVRALRLTRWDDFGGEWGLKLLVDANSLVKGKKKIGGEDVLIDALGPTVVIYDTSMNPLAISLQDIDLQRDKVYGKREYQSAVEIILGVSADSDIPTFQKEDPLQPYNPTTNPYKVIFLDDPLVSLVEKINISGVEMVNYFGDLIDWNLNLWSQDKFGLPWNQVFPSQAAAIDALKFDDRYIADLEDPFDPVTKGGNYAFIQHYTPRVDNLGPLYDWNILRSYYDNGPKDVPKLKLRLDGRVDGPILKDRDGNVLYDPDAPVGPDGFIDITALYNASLVDRNLQSYWRTLGNIPIANGLSSRYHYFNFDFAQRAYKSYITGGVDPTPQPIMGQFFSPYIWETFHKRMGTKYLQTTTASASNYDTSTKLITYINYLDAGDIRKSSQQGGRRSTFVHEWLMGHAMQQPLIQMIASLGLSPWTANAFLNGAVAEGWAVFVETFFCATYTTYLSETDHYFNYTSNNGPADPKAVVSQLLNASRVAARLKWDTAYHGGIINPDTGVEYSMADFFRGFKANTFGTFDANTEVAQRIPVTPSQALNYGLAFCTLVGLFQQLSKPTAEGGIGTEKFNELQANGNKAFKYFFDFVLIDTVGAFLGSIKPAYDSLVKKIANGIPPFDDPNYDGYPIGAFPVTTNAYVEGSNPAVYEYTSDPFISGGFSFKFPDSATPV